MMTTSILRSVSFATLAAGALATTGCLKFEQKATIQKDGSGTLTQNISIDLDAMKRLQEFAKTFAGGGPGGDDEKGGEAKPASDDGLLPYNLTDIQDRAKKVPGLQIRNAKTEHRYIMDFEAVFASWSTLGQANLFPGSAELVKNENGTYTFTLDMMAGQGGKAGDDAGATGGMDPSMIMALLEPMVGTLEFKQSLTLPGTIVETNGTKSEDGMTVNWKVGFKDLTSGKDANLMKVTFKGEGLELKPFKFAPDLQDVMNRVQGKRPPTAPVVTPSTDGPAPAPGMDAPK